MHPIKLLLHLYGFSLVFLAAGLALHGSMQGAEIFAWLAGRGPVLFNQFLAGFILGLFTLFIPQPQPLTPVRDRRPEPAGPPDPDADPSHIYLKITLAMFAGIVIVGRLMWQAYANNRGSAYADENLEFVASIALFGGLLSAGIFTAVTLVTVLRRRFEL